MGTSSGRNSVAECQLPKLDVAGSNPVGRSKLSGATGHPVAPASFYPTEAPPPLVHPPLIESDLRGSRFRTDLRFRVADFEAFVPLPRFLAMASLADRT